MNLVSIPLSGSNYLTWNRSILIALRAKDKLDFINGTCKKPDNDFKDLEKWLKVESMAISWILNSISKEIVEAFLYSP